jgi:mRNA interferase RelE/StbE
VRYEIEWRRSALRKLGKLDPQIARRLKAAVEALSVDPRPAGVVALRGLPGALRLRVGDWRIVYEVRDSVLVVLVVDLGHRSEVYRDRS